VANPPEQAGLEDENWNTFLAGGAAAVLAAAEALPERGDLAAELDLLEAATDRGYFPPDADELVRLRYSQYLGLRAALWETLVSCQLIALHILAVRFRILSALEVQVKGALQQNLWVNFGSGRFPSV
jgi:hypothetical protein